MTRPVALVTGAASGLGRSVAGRLAARGYDVVATDVRDGEGVTRVLDVADTASARATAAWIAAEYGRLDLVVSNAGIIGFFPVVEADPDEVVGHFQVNTFGALRVVHACLDLLVASRGRVVVISSESYRFRNPFQIYQSTKLALEGVCDVLRRELAPLGVRLATVRPGPMRTQVFDALATVPEPAPGSRLARPFGRFARLLARRPPRRVIEPDAAAEAVVRIATGRRLRAHHTVNAMPGLRLAALVPAGLVDRVLLRAMR